MSEQKYQTHRPDRHKPSVVKEYTYWWARVYTADGEFRTDLLKSHSEALAKAYEYAELNREVTA